MTHISSIVLLLLSTFTLLLGGCRAANEVVTFETTDASQEFDLPDGSTVLLNVNSQLVFNKPFKKELRQVSLKGEAYFDIKGAKEWPFQVSTWNLYYEY